ncbi:MAG: alpha/beta hydrolase [Gemmatimonadaceae bacterium]|nr:alpha/beta hydrolase [Gemmatimonadaceae bacterium]
MSLSPVRADTPTAARSVPDFPAIAPAIDTIGVLSARPERPSALVVVDWRAPWWKRIRSRVAMSPESVSAWAAARGGRVVVYVHGAGTSADRAVRQGATLARRGGHRGATVVIPWPTHALGVTWPRSRAGLAQGYVDDSLAAVSSDSVVHTRLARLAQAVPPESVVVLAHSLGARLVTRVLSGAPLRAPIGTVALLAGDVGVTEFTRDLAPALRRATRRPVIYVGRGDRMLWLSRMRHDESRIGEARSAGMMASAGVEVVDAGALPLRGALFRALGTRHAVTRLDGAVADLFGPVLQGTPRQAVTDSAGVIRLTRPRR